MRKARVLIIPLVVLAMDQLSKLWLETANIRLLPGLVRLRGHRNTGAAFGLLGTSSALIGLLSLAIAIGIAVYLIKMKPSGLLFVGLSLMLGGALGNLVDRAILGYVIDFIELEFMRFPVFNLADIAVTTGCVLAAIGILTLPEPARG